MSDTGTDPPRCRCGFWGSSQTLNLCSKCYKDEIKRSGANEASDFTPEILDVQEEVNGTPKNGVSKEEKNCGGLEGVAESRMSVEESPAEPEPLYLPKDRAIQKNKKRCWECQGKLELAQRELGKCRCGYTFCQVHRLPEKHNCIFDHKESGREEARQKMVPSGPRKVGRSFQRIDE